MVLSRKALDLLPLVRACRTTLREAPVEVTQAVLLPAAGGARTKVLGGAVALSLAWRPKRAVVPPGRVPLGKGLLMWGGAIGAAWAAASLT